MDMSSTINRHFQQTKGQFYQNSGYCDSRTDKQLLVIDIQDNGSAGLSKFTDSGNDNFSVNLYEPLKIDTLSDIYLDNFTTYDAFANSPGPDNNCFVVTINEFSIKSNSNNSLFYNKIVIPNEVTATNKLQVHKARKMNYVCSINPGTLTKISGKITGTAGASMDGGTGEVYRVTMEFIIVARN